MRLERPNAVTACQSVADALVEIENDTPTALGIVDRTMPGDDAARVPLALDAKSDGVRFTTRGTRSTLTPEPEGMSLGRLGKPFEVDALAAADYAAIAHAESKRQRRPELLAAIVGEFFRLPSRQHVPDAANGVDHSLVGAKVDLVAKIVDVHVQHVAAVLGVLAPNLMQDLLAGERGLIVTNHKGKQLRLAGGEGGFYLAPTNRARDKVELDVGVGDHVPAGRVGSTQNRKEPGGEFGDVEWFA